MEFIDDLLTFQDLGEHLRSSGCHIANLSYSDFAVKHGIAGCLKSLLRQLVMVSLEVGFYKVFSLLFSPTCKLTLLSLVLSPNRHMI